MARYAKAEIRSEDGETTVKARFDIATYKWQVEIVGPVTNPANRAPLAQEWERTLQSTTEHLQGTLDRSVAQGAPWAVFFAETARINGFTVVDPLPPGKPDAEPLEY